MNMFSIQVSNPRTLKEHDPEDESLSDALQAVFPMFTEDAYLGWGVIAIPLGYKYDVSLMAEDAVNLVEAMLGSSSGVWSNGWLSDTFDCTWNVTWADRRFEVHALWRSVHGPLADLLNRAGPISGECEQFMAEWKALFELLYRALTEAGYRESQIRKLSNLGALAKTLPKRGVLYV